MPLPPELVAQFSPDVRARGDEYWRARRVHLLDADDPAEVVALVRGSAPYEVTLRRRGRGRVVMDCTCPYLESHDAPCKHLWATVLEAERIGHPVVAAAGGAPEGDEEDDEDDRGRGELAAPPWRRELERLAAALPFPPGAREPEGWPAGRRLVYIVDAYPTLPIEHGLPIELALQSATREGGWRPPKRFGLSYAQWLAAPDPVDREITQFLVGAREVAPYGTGYGSGYGGSTRRFQLPPSAFPTTLRRLCETGRCRLRLRPDDGDPPALAWDGASAWRLALTLDEVPGGGARAARYRIAGTLVDALVDASALAREVPLASPTLLGPGLMVCRVGGEYVAAAFDDHGATDLVRALRGGAVLEAPAAEALALSEAVAARYPRLPPAALPDSLGIAAVRVAPRPSLALTSPPRGPSMGAKVDGAVAFDYDGVSVDADAPGATVMAPAKDVPPAGGRRRKAGAAAPAPARVVYRDRVAERAALARLEVAGFRHEADYRMGVYVHRIPAARAAAAADALAAEGWVVTLDGRTLRHGGNAALAVSTGVDWFDLGGEVDFDGVRVPFPELLGALRRGDRTLALPDGSTGLVPESWASRFGALAALSAPAGSAPAGGAPDGPDAPPAGAARFARSQAALLDALLASEPAANVDAAFRHARAALAAGEAPEPLDPPPGFGAELRPYQRAGLGWLDFLRRTGFGGVLADDMGLGKTVQVLALLEARRQAGAGPSLAVVPRSLVFNWVREAERFAPAMRVRVHHGPGRKARVAALGDYDLMLTTYGTLRQDAADMRDVEFDYAVLDEAQAIKNAGTATAKAARLLRARHRLAVTGTPVENRLDDLWSLFEFLTPGLLGAAPAFARLVQAGDDGGAAGREAVARGVRPFLLRRTKAQVAPELPPRTEQTVWVDLGPTERRLYDELRDHYRASVAERAEQVGAGRAQVHVLEALLRLRQAACHPGLIDAARREESSSKLDVLVDRLAESTAEGHKAVVFSQFTSMLALVRARLDAEGVVYEYLDGRTRDRAARVERFQGDPACPVFLVSLKAGGVGLNLTAADYVFLLDPWWNPAAEAQAIDRAHRIGQTRPVHALRLVARGTVEEKVLELQAGKRALADAVVRSDDGAPAGLTAEDLRGLLG